MVSCGENPSLHFNEATVPTIYSPSNGSILCITVLFSTLTGSLLYLTVPFVRLRGGHVTTTKNSVHH